jgi:esterase
MMVIPSASIALLHNSCISWRTTHSSNHLHSIVRLDSILRNRIHTSRQRRHSNAHSTTIQVLYSTTTTTTTTSTAEYHTDDTTTQEQVDLNYIEFSDPMISTTSEASPSPAASSKPPVILLHGLLGQKRNFASLGTSLASQLETPRRIFALDLRNHGDNSHDWRDDMSYSHMADDVLGFINKMGLEQVVLVGHSMGGKVAHSLALSYPERVAGLVVMDIAPVTYTCQDASWSAVQDIIQALESVTLEQKTKRDVEMELRANVSDPALRAFVMTNLETRKGGSLVWKIHIDAISKQLDKIASFDVNYQDEQKFIELLDQEMMRYMGDTFVIKGGSSSFIKGSHMETISRLFPNYMLTTVKGAGHWVHAEAPEATLALLKTYLDR